MRQQSPKRQTNKHQAVNETVQKPSTTPQSQSTISHRLRDHGPHLGRGRGRGEGDAPLHGLRLSRTDAESMLDVELNQHVPCRERTTREGWDCFSKSITPGNGHDDVDESLPAEGRAAVRTSIVSKGWAWLGSKVPKGAATTVYRCSAWLRGHGEDVITRTEPGILIPSHKGWSCMTAVHRIQPHIDAHGTNTMWLDTVKSRHRAAAARTRTRGGRVGF